MYIIMFHHVNKVFIWPKVIFRAVNHLRYSMHGVGLRVMSSPSLSRYFLENFFCQCQSNLCQSNLSDTLCYVFSCSKASIVLWQNSSSFWIGEVWSCLDCSLFNPKFGPLDASFFALNGSRARISWEKNGISFSPIHAWSYPFLLAARSRQ